MTSSNCKLITKIIEAVDAFKVGDLGIERMRETLEASLGLLERGVVDFDSEIRSAEFDLDNIQYTLPEGDRHSAAVARMNDLRVFLWDNLSREAEGSDESL
jgi:hypothetical protein